MMTKHFITEVKKHRQNKQSYIIYLSSVVGDIRNPFTTAFYQASKVQNKIFGRLVYYPSNSLDYIIIKPGWVSTPLTQNRKVDAFTSSIDQEMTAIMGSIGWTRETYA